MPFVKYDPWPGHEFGAGDFTDHTGRSTPLYDPGLAQQLTANNASVPEPNQSVPDVASTTEPHFNVTTGPVTDTNFVEAPAPKPGAPVANGRDYEAGASEFLKANRQNPGATQTTPDGKVMVVEPHPAAPERGLPIEHPGVTVREPAASKVTPEEDLALDSVIKKYPNLTKQGLLKMFQGEGGYEPLKGFNPTADNGGHSGIFQLEKAQQKQMGISDITKKSAAEQIADVYPRYLEGKHAPSDIQDSDLGLLQAGSNLVGKPDDYVAYPANSEGAINNPAWQKASGANGDVTVGGLKKYYGSIGQGSAGGEPGKPQTKEQALAAYINGSAGGPSTEQRTITKTESGTPYSAEDQAGLFARTEKHNADMAAAYQPVLDAQAKAVEQGIATHQKIQDSMDAAQYREQAAKTLYDESMGRVRTGVDEVLADKQPPPFGGNIFATILASIAQGMGAYAAAINKTDNFAANAINTALKRENDRWAQAHLDKQYKVKNDQELSRDQWYQYKSALSERELQQRMLIDHELQQNLALSKNADSTKALNLMIADNNAHMETENANQTRLSRGRVTTEIMSEQKQKEGDNSLADQNKRAQSAVDSGLYTPEEVASARGGAVPVPDKKMQAYVSGPREGVPGRAGLDVQEHNLLTIPHATGFVFDDKTKKFAISGEDNVARNPLTGGVSPTTRVVSKLWHTPEENEKRAEAQTRMSTITNAQMYLDSGKAVTKEEAEKKAAEFNGLSQEDQLKQLNELYDGLQVKKRALASEFVGAEEEYDRRYKNRKEKDPGAIDFTKKTP